MLELQSAGAVTFDYGNNIRAQAEGRRRGRRLRHSRLCAGVHPSAVLRGQGPFRWVALSGDPEDIYAHRSARAGTVPARRIAARWITLARERIHFQGLAGAHLLAGLRRTRRVRPGASTDWCARGEFKAPIVIGRDHLDAGSVASPYRETEGMRDGSDAIADWPLLNALLNTAAGASWVSIHNGGGVGIGYSQHAGMVVVADGTDEMAARLERVLTDRSRHRRRSPCRRGYPEAIAVARKQVFDCRSSPAETAMPDDPYWPRASAWLEGNHHPDAVGAWQCWASLCDSALSLRAAATSRRRRSGMRSTASVRMISTADVDVRQLIVAIGRSAAGRAESREGAFVRWSMLSARRARHDAAVLMGGDNSISRPGVHALGVALERCALLTLDAHLDLRTLENGLSNGNPVRALLEDGLAGDHIVQIGIQNFANSPEYAAVARNSGIRLITAEAVRERTTDAVIEESLAILAKRAEVIYVDLDLDVMDRVFAPATPGSRPGGLTPAQIRRAAHLCGLHPKVRVLDLVEMDPTRDVAQSTALAAAACMLSFASGVVRRLRAARS